MRNGARLRRPRRAQFWNCQQDGCHQSNPRMAKSCAGCGKPRRKVFSTGKKGSANERRSRDYLINRGYTVIKAGASLGAFDLIAWNAERVLYVQVKTNQWPNPAEREAMRQTPVPFNGYKLCHRWNNGMAWNAPPIVRRVEGAEATLRRELEKGGFDLPGNKSDMAEFFAEVMQ